MLALGIPIAAAAVSERSLEYYEEAQSFLEKGKIQAAIIQLKNAIREDPNNAKARFDLGVIYLRTGQGAAAEKELRAAQEAGMPAEQVLPPLADALIAQNKLDELLEDIDPLAFSGDMRAKLHVARSQAFLARQEQTKAEDELKTALEISPNLAIARLTYSKLLQSKGDLAAAEDQVERALEEDPDLTQAVTQKAELLRLQGKIEAALDLFDKAIESNPLSGEARLGRAAALIARQDYEKARSDIGAVLERQPDHSMARYLDTLALAQMGETRDALETLRGTLGLDRFPPAQYMLGALNLRLESFAQAYEAANRYRSLRPEDPAGRVLMARVELARGNPDTAAALLEPVKEISQNVQLYGLLGSAYIAAGRYADAANLYSEAVELDPDQASLQLRLAQSWLGSGDMQQALETLDALVERDPESIEANVLLILTHLRQNDFAKAEKAVDRLEQNTPDDSPVAENFRGMIAIAQGDIDSARASFERVREINPEFHGAALNLAVLDRRTGDLESAAARYKSVLEQEPEHRDALMGLAAVQSQQGDLDAAIESVRKIQEFAPDSAEAHVTEVNLLLAQDQSDKALVEARQMLNQVGETPQTLDALGRAQLAAGQEASAVATVRRAAALDPESAQLRYRVGEVMASVGRTEEAADEYEAAFRMNPQFEQARQRRVAMEREMNGAGAAIDLAREMSGLHGRHPRRFRRTR